VNRLKTHTSAWKGQGRCCSDFPIWSCQVLHSVSQIPSLFKTQCLLIEITNQADLCGSLGGTVILFFFFFFCHVVSKETLRLTKATD
jgi:hypothetical protein